MMEARQWQDPLLITDVSVQEEDELTNTCRSNSPAVLSSPTLATFDSTSEGVHQTLIQLVPVTEGLSAASLGLSMFGFSSAAHNSVSCAGSPNIYHTLNYVPITEESPEIMKWARIEEMNPRMDISFDKDVYCRKIVSTSPDLIMCEGSPNVPQISTVVSPKFMKSIYDEDFEPNVDISFDNFCDGGCISPPQIKHEPTWQTPSKQDSFELFPQPENQGNDTRALIPITHLNSGLIEGDMISFCGVNYETDHLFEGGTTMKVDAEFRDGKCCSIYQTARCGNFSYKFQFLEPGIYVVDFHFSEVVYRSAGMRVFNILIQDEKVVSSFDIYDRVGVNKPLVLSDLKTSVNADGELSIRFEGVVGSPILCGISLWRDICQSSSAVELSDIMKISSTNEKCGDLNLNRASHQLCEECQVNKNELQETKRLIEELQRENQMKSRECQEACKSLQELQNELMRKSMHVGSLAFAVEGQVKEKTKWFSLLRDLTRKLKIMKMEQIELSKIATDYKKCLSDYSDMSSIIQSTISREVDLHHDLRVKFIEALKDRKILYNKVLELKGNIRVFCRSRPLKADEIASGASMAIDFEPAKNGELLVKSSGVSKKVFKFDAVFSPEADQAEVFQDTAPLVSSVLDGYNVCIFAYGQTGTGKTYTMVGTEEARGVNYRTLDELFRLMKKMEHQYQYEVSVSVLEVYNEQIRDLLVSGTQPGISTKRLEIRQVGDGVHHVPGLVEAHVKNMSEVWEVLQAGSNARAVGATNANEYSSRSHCMHCVMVKSKNLLNGECTRSKLWLVDLAGSERIAKTEVQGERLKEAQNINRSLSALGDVISALATKSPHVPFRNSKLTHLLQDSLGGDSKALMFVQISPNDDDLSETLCSLNFACRVRGVELSPAKKQVDTTEFLKYKQMVERMKQELKSKDAQVNKMDDVIRNLDLRWKETNTKNKLLVEKVKELELQLHIERKIAQQSTDSKQAGLQQQTRQQQEHVTAATRPPLASRPLGLYKNISDQQDETLYKEQANGPGSFAQNNCYKSSDPLAPNTGLVKRIDVIEKENNPDLDELNILPQRTGRASSICMTAMRASILPKPRRNSFIPPPNIPTSTQVTTPFLPMHPTRTNDLSNGGYQRECFPQPISEESPRGLRNGGKKINSILRGSLQKKIQIKPVIQQQMRKGGVNVGERIRLSIQGRGRMARRVLLGNNGGRRPDSATLHKHIQEKEKGWNNGTGGRNLL